MPGLSATDGHLVLEGQLRPAESGIKEKRRYVKVPIILQNLSAKLGLRNRQVVETGDLKNQLKDLMHSILKS